jgi:DNA adenine methylase
VPFIQSLWKPHRRRRLVEPFCGGLAIALGLRPHRALLNDVNPHLINFYRWLQRGVEMGPRLENSESAYYQHRQRFNVLVAEGLESTREAATLFYYLNRTGYNGLCRFNRQGAFNVPFGRYKKIGYEADFLLYRQVFEEWTFTVGDLVNVSLEADDFVYADPPYDVEFTQYAKDRFGWEDQQRAAEWLSTHRGPVVLANQATKRIEHLYRTLGYSVEFLAAPRRISCTGDRTPAREIIATRNL